MGQVPLTSGYRNQGNLEGPAHSPLAPKPSLPDGHRSAECPLTSPWSLKLVGTLILASPPPPASPSPQTDGTEE